MPIACCGVSGTWLRVSSCFGFVVVFVCFVMVVDGFVFVPLCSAVAMCVVLPSVVIHV